MDDPYDALTEKEKQALRLMVRGHDAKSMARELSLSVHTINERLRVARRKLGVTSSREAARLLLETERSSPENLVNAKFGDAHRAKRSEPGSIAQFTRKRVLVIGGLFTMLALSLIAILAVTHPGAERPIGDPATAIETVQLDAFESTASAWLALVDAFDWDGSFAAAGRSFRDPNTVAMWRDASLQARVPLGAVIERKVQTVELTESAEKDGSGTDRVVVRFATRFENRSDAIETVTLEQEYGEWKVVGYMID